jgi:hypothetical protein
VTFMTHTPEFIPCSNALRLLHSLAFGGGNNPPVIKGFTVDDELRSRLRRFDLLLALYAIYIFLGHLLKYTPTAAAQYEIRNNFHQLLSPYYFKFIH